jgi:hypothetical protein
MFGSQLLRERCLAGLSRADDGDHWKDFEILKK